MTVRRRVWKGGKDGRREAWLADVQVTLVDGTVRRVRRVSPAGTRQAAELLEQELRGQLLSGSLEPSPRGSLRLGELWPRFLEHCASSGESPSEVERKRRMLLRHVLPRLGELPLARVTTAALRAYAAQQLARGLAPKSINNQLALLSRLLRAAVAWQELASVPRVRWLSPAPVRPASLEADAAARLVAAADADYQPLLALAIHARLRLCELLELRWEDVDLEAARLVVRGREQREGGARRRSRVVALNEAALASLARHRPSLGRVFGGSAGERLTHGACRSALARAARRAGVEGRVTWRSLRESLAAELGARGGPALNVREPGRSSWPAVASRARSSSSRRHMTAHGELTEPRAAEFMLVRDTTRGWLPRVVAARAAHAGSVQLA